MLGAIGARGGSRTPTGFRPRDPTSTLPRRHEGEAGRRAQSGSRLRASSIAMSWQRGGLRRELLLRTHAYLISAVASRVVQVEVAPLSKPRDDIGRESAMLRIAPLN